MSHWKAILNKSKTSRSNLAGKSTSRSKFSPTKIKDDDAKSIRFKNESISRAYDSMIADSKDRSMSRSMMRGNFNDSRVIKNSASASQLQKIKPTQNILENLNPPVEGYETPRLQTPPVPPSKSNPQQLQIERLKRDFLEFQQLIFRELKRQEAVINDLVSQILQQIKVSKMEAKQEQKSFSPRLQPQSPLTLLEKEFNIKRYDSIEAKSGSKADILNVDNEHKKEDRPQYASMMTGQGSKEKLSLNRFFTAMNSLKQQMKDISSLSNLEHPRNPIDQTKWSQAMERLKRKKTGV